MRDKRDLVRVVHTPDDQFQLDPKGKLPGRGAYVCPDPACLQNAVKRKAFDRAFKQTLSPEAVAALDLSVRELLTSRREEPADAGQAPSVPGSSN